MQNKMRIIAVLLALLYVFGIMSVYAVTDDLLPDDIIIPKMSKIESLIFAENFDGSTIDSRWTNMGRVMQSNGNYVGKAELDKVSTFGLSKVWLGDCTFRMNFKLDYSNDNWVEVLDIKYKNENTKGKIMFTSAGDNPRLIFQTVGQANNLWYTYSLPDKSVFEGKWQFLKVTVNGSSVLIYLNDELNPVISAENFSLANSTFGFKGYSSSIYIDNLLISAAKDLPEVTVKPELENKLVLAHQDFEGSEPSSESGFTNGSITDAEDERAYSFSPVISTGNILGMNYCVEFNLLADFDETTHLNIIADADELGGGYIFTLGKSGSGSSSFDFTKVVSGAAESVGITAGNGHSNWADADNIWSYYKIEKNNGTLKLYFNDKDKPAYTIEDPAPLGGGSFVIKTDGESPLYIDNFAVTANDEIKRMFVNKMTGSAVEISSTYQTDAECKLFLFYYNNKKLIKTEEAELTVPGSVNDGRDFSYIEYPYDKEAYSADEVKAYVIDKASVTPSSAEAEVSCSDITVSAAGKIGGIIDRNMLIVIEPLTGGNPVAAEIVHPAPDGSFNYSYDFYEEQLEGDYWTLIYDGKNTDVLQNEFQYLSDTNLEKFISKLNQSKNNPELFAKMLVGEANELYLRRLGVFISKFNNTGEYKSEDVRRFSTDILENAEFSKENTGVVLNSAIYAALIQQAPDGTETGKIIETFPGIYNISERIKELYNANKEKISFVVYSGVCHEKNRCVSSEDTGRVFEEQVVLSLIYKSNYIDIYDILKNYTSVSLSELPASESERNKIMAKMNKNQFYTFDELEEYLKRAIKEYNDGKTPGQSSAPKGPSSPGGGRGGGFSYVTNEAPNKPGDINKEITGNTVNITYDDVDHDYWAYEYIKALSDLDVIRGYDDEKFYPERKLSRAELCKLLSKAFNLSPDSDNPFADVAEDSWYKPYVSAAYSAGLVKGTGDGSFVPDAHISRQDMATVLYRLMENKGVKIENGQDFDDMSEISAYAQTAVKEMAEAGILNGYNGKFSPLRGTTRAEAAKMIYLVLDITEKREVK